jgi:hypothetical protein
MGIMSFARSDRLVAQPQSISSAPARNEVRDRVRQAAQLFRL